MKRGAILIWIKNETVREHRDAPRIAADFGKSLVEGWLRGTAIVPRKEFLLNLRQGLIQPLLGVSW